MDLRKKEQIARAMERKRQGKTNSFYCALCGRAAEIIDVEVIKDPEEDLQWKRVFLECQTCEDSLSQTIDVPMERYTIPRKMNPNRGKRFWKGEKSR